MTSDRSYPIMTEDKWTQLLEEDDLPDCEEFPRCPLNFDNKEYCACVLWLIDDFDYTSFVEICGRTGLLRKQLRVLSPTTKTEVER